MNVVLVCIYIQYAYTHSSVDEWVIHVMLMYVCVGNHMHECHRDTLSYCIACLCMSFA